MVVQVQVSASRPRVLVADDHRPTLAEWRALLEPEFEVVGSAGCGRSLIDAAAALHPDVIVSDITMPGLDGICAAECILRANPSVRIVFATAHADQALLRRSEAAGALGYVLKVAAGDDLVPAVRAALKGDRYLSALPAASGIRGAGNR